MKYLTVIVLLCFCGCAPKQSADKSGTILSMQIIDRNGFTETISNKDRLCSFKDTNFLSPQPFQKVLRIYGRNLAGQSTSKITSYHDNGSLCQYLEAVDGRAHGLYQEWHPNGQLKIETQVIEGTADIHELAQASWVFEGLCQVQNEQGQKIAEFHYNKGLLEETASYFFPDGKLQKKIPYAQGEIHGIYQLLDEEGNILEEIPYAKGEKEGVARAYWAPGIFLSEEHFEGGLLQEASYFDREGNCIAKVEKGEGKLAQFQEGKLYCLSSITKGRGEGEVSYFNPDGTLHISYILKEGKKQGEEWEYFPYSAQETPRAKLCIHWNEDRIEGQVKTWYPNGQAESQREIHNNKKQGNCFAWYKNGELMLLEEYENDLLLKGSYYKKGDKKAVSKVDSGKGIAYLYTAEGIFSKKVSYEKGKPLLHNDSMN